MDFITLSMEQLVNQAAKLRFMLGGRCRCPFACARRQARARRSGGHSESLENWFVHVPGLKVVMPSTPTDARAAAGVHRGPEPGHLCGHKLLYRTRA